MSALLLSKQLALVAADPVLVSHPVVARLVAVMDCLTIELSSLRGLWRRPVRAAAVRYGAPGGLPRGRRRPGAVRSICGACCIQHLPVARVRDALQELHVLCDGRLTLYRLGPRRAVWTEYTGTAARRSIGAGCNAHLLRNLEEIVEPEQEKDGWAARCP